jgi:hypothetical protein
LSGSFFNTSIALAVGKTTNLVLRRLASVTSSMTGNAPVPVPITSRRHFQGIFFLHRQRGVSEGVAKLFGGLLFAFADLPVVDDHVVLVGDPIDANRTK